MHGRNQSYPIEDRNNRSFFLSFFLFSRVVPEAFLLFVADKSYVLSFLFL